MFGSLIVIIKEAKLTRDTEILGKMDPFVVMKAGDFEVRTSVKESAGKTPVWNETFCFRVKKDENVKFDIFDEEDLQADKLIGSGNFEINELDDEDKSFVFPVIYKEENVGELFVELKFIPEVVEEQVILNVEKKMSLVIEEQKVSSEKLSEELGKVKNELMNSQRKIKEFDKNVQLKEEITAKFDQEKNLNKNLNIEIEKIKKELKQSQLNFQNLSKQYVEKEKELEKEKEKSKGKVMGKEKIVEKTKEKVVEKRKDEDSLFKKNDIFKILISIFIGMVLSRLFKNI